VIGAVIVTGVEVGLAADCVRSLAPSVPSDRIVVVVNPPGADAPERAELDGIAIVVDNDTPTGYGACLNLGVRALPDDVQLVLLLNDDVVVDPDALAQLVTALEAHQEAAVAGPNLVDRTGTPEPTAFAFPSVRSELTQIVLLPQSIHASLRHRYAALASPGPPRLVDWVLGAALLVRRSAFDAVGGFDERYVFYSEETDLCRRLRDRGWRTLSCGSATFVHIRAASQQRGLEVARRFEAQAGVSRRRYLRLHWSSARRAALAVGTVLAFAWSAGYVLVRVVLSPSTARSKLDLLRSRWVTRPTLRGGDTA
jgi:N-acetylglucosaminyl-diphospho-decaprenol L-rhamnosyltransferase